MRLAPDASAPLFERVLYVINDVDPERFLVAGGPSDEYRAAAKEFTCLLQQGETVTPELVAAEWRHRFAQKSWLLEPAHRYVLNKFARRIAGLAP